MRKIVTSHVFPPIPTRQFDWCAFYDGDEESGNYGYGATEAEAVKDFLENCTSERCSLDVGCDEYGVCYAAAHGQPEQCGRA